MKPVRYVSSNGGTSTVKTIAFKAFSMNLDFDLNNGIDPCTGTLAESQKIKIDLMSA